MKRTAIFVSLLSLLCGGVNAQQEDSFDYFATNRMMIRNGVQAVLMCNGLFTSNRTLEQVFKQELAYLNSPRFPGVVGTADGGEFEVRPDLKAVAIGGPESGTIIRAAFREGIGCVVMPPDQSFDDIDALPQLLLPYEGNAANIPWPNGDLVASKPLAHNIDAGALQAASNWAFDRDTPEQDTLSLMVVYKGDIVHERYAPGVNMFTRTRTWSTAKSIAATLIGMLVDQGKMDLDAPLGFEWLPEIRTPDADPRNEITLRNALQMSTGLDPVDNKGMEYVTGSGVAYWAGASSTSGARRRALVREPGTYWDYENYDTLLAVLAMKNALGDDETYHEFPRRALFDKIGMRNTLASADRFHDFILSSQVYTNARDLARFGLLYAQGGIWNGERLISEDWINFIKTPAPATADRGNFYGAQWWLVPDDRTDVPKNAYSTSGNRGQFVIVVPDSDLVIVRRGLDYNRQGFDRWGLVREVLKAIGTEETISSN
jgi:CubicO group peptidase (beta-lactamase class C family)